MDYPIHFYWAIIYLIPYCNKYILLSTNSYSFTPFIYSANLIALNCTTLNKVFFKKFFFSLILFPLLANFSYAQEVTPVLQDNSPKLDITLQDYPEEGYVNLLINSNDNYVDAFSLNIAFSPNIRIEDVIMQGRYCSMNQIVDLLEQEIVIHCFNSQEEKVAGSVAKIYYNIIGPDEYYLYIDINKTDIGDFSFGSVTDLNKPEGIEFTQDIVEFDDFNRTETKDSSLVNFFTENYVYIFATLGVLFVVAFFVVAKKPESN
jgi:hypothetical protein